MRYGILVLLLIALLLLFPFHLEEHVDIKDVMKDYPWVRFANATGNERELHFLSLVEHLAKEDSDLGMSVAQTLWLQDYILKEEGEVLDSLSAIADSNIEIAKNISHTFWFKEPITPEKVEFLDAFASLVRERPIVARTVSQTKWFALFVGGEESEVVRMLAVMDGAVAQKIAESSWFSASASDVEIDSARQIDIFSKNDGERVSQLLSFFEPRRDLPNLREVNVLARDDPVFLRQYFSLFPLTSDTLSSVSSLSVLRSLDSSFSERLIQESPSLLASLATIAKRDPDVARLLYDNFGANETVMRFASRYASFRPIGEKSSFLETCLFVSRNPEFVYEDTKEKYRYDLLNETISSFPPEYVYDYKSLIFQAIRIYANRFYEWDDPIHGKLYGWSSDETLSGFEKEGYLALLNYLIGENEAGTLVTDIRVENGKYLSALLDIPYEYLINYDGTIVENSGEERGTYYIYAIVYNIKTLPTRRRNLESLTAGKDVKYRTYLVDYILTNGEKKDVYFILINAKNWDIAERQNERVCVYQTYQTLMDAIALGIAPTEVYWKSKETGHLYPAYLASPTVLRAIESRGAYWRSPFVYKGYLSPYDQAGYRNLLGTQIEYVSIYDHEAENFVNIYSGIQETYTTTLLLVSFIVVAVVCGAWLLRKK
jgi:hypothetical protein